MELAVSRLVLDTLQSSSNTISKGQQHVEHFSHRHPLNDFSWILFYDSKKKSCPANRTTLRPKLQYDSWEMMAAISCPANSSWHFMPQQKEFAGDFVANKLNRVLHVFCYHFLLSFFAPANNFKILHHCLSPNSF